MNVKWGFCAALAVGMSATFAAAVDKDGVPTVDLHGKIVETTDAKAIATAKQYGFAIPSQRIIEVDGKPMTLQQFMLTYCLGKVGNATCHRARKIDGIDGLKGPKRDLPAGL